MTDTAPKSFFRRFALDMATGFAGFSAITAVGLFETASAGEIAKLAATGSPASVSGVVLLGTIISVLYALNVGFYRHLKTAYAPIPRPAGRSVRQSEA